MGVDVEELPSLVRAAASAASPPAERLEAFGEIVRRFQDMVYGCAYARLGDFHLAEDAAQEAFLAAYRELPNLREPRAFAGWLRRIVLSRCGRLTRRRRVPTTGLAAAAGVACGQPRPVETLERQEMRDKVLGAIRGLPAPQRMATTLFYINGYSQKDIAEFLDVPVVTVKKRLAGARSRLKQRMISMVDETLKSHPLPDGFADMVVRKAASQEDLARAAALLGYSGRTRPEHFTSPARAEEAGIYVVGEEGSVEAAGYFNEFALSIGGTVLRAVRPHEMGVEAEGVPHPAFVKGFQACFRLARERGICVSAVHGSQYDHAFVGFVPCFYYPVATLPAAAVRDVETVARVEPADEPQARAARRAWLSDPWAPKMSAYIGGGEPHVVRQDGEIVGHARVDRRFRPADHYGMPFGHVTDVTVQTRDAAIAVLRLAGELTAAAGDETICLMQSHKTLITQTMLHLGGTYRLRGSCDVVGLDAEMVAILDLPGLARQLEGELEPRFAASSARDAGAALSIEMAGQTVGFVAEGGTLRIVQEPQEVHRPLPRWVVTRLVTGYYSGGDLLTMGPIPWDRSDGTAPDDPELDNRPLALPEAEAALLAALFPKLWPCSWPDPDVWPWVIGREHPRYQGEDRKTPEMKARIDALRFPWLGR